uniref:Retroviral polymerase SH3-like domain-containing protein n=1 Tax=Tanacetum cinerariifolium TaxID=118510 RepID=A0A699HPE1_TANCI|nr:hypothetical protein [Tanacetum cinerariifolium]
MMNLIILPKSFWGYALEYVVRILNMVPTKKVERTSYEIWHEKPPKLSYLRVWGCKALVKRDTLDKLDPRSVKYIFVGYPKETIGCYFYYPLENKIFVARNAEFFENNLMVQEASGSHGPLESRDFDEPPNYKPVLSYPESEKRLEAINIEMQSIKDNKVWVLVELPPNGQTVGSKWRFKKKTDMDGKKTLRMENSKNGYTPMIEKPYYRKSQGAKTPSEVQRMRRVPYALAIDPSEIQWTTVKTILKYLRNTNDMVLVYEAKPKAELKVSCYADASFQIDKDDTKSKTRYVFVLNGGSVDWKSAKQSTTVMSSTEVEYITAAEASMKSIWMRKFIDGLGNVMPSNKRPIKMPRDNEAAIAITNDPGILKGARHFQRKYHYIREVIQECEIVLKKVHTDDNVVDPFTKPMSFNKYFKHDMAIGIIPASSLM